VERNAHADTVRFFEAIAKKYGLKRIARAKDDPFYSLLSSFYEVIQ
jgi:hypothetical protein